MQKRRLDKKELPVKDLQNLLVCTTFMTPFDIGLFATKDLLLKRINIRIPISHVHLLRTKFLSQSATNVKSGRFITIKFYVPIFKYTNFYYLGDHTSKTRRKNIKRNKKVFRISLRELFDEN